MKLRNLVLALLFAAGCVSDRDGIADADAYDDLCEVVGQLDNYVGRTIRVRGTVRTDFSHLAGVADPRCPATFLVFGPERYVEVGMDELWSALQRMRAGGGSVQASGTIDRGPAEVSLVLNVRAFSDVTYSASESE